MTAEKQQPLPDDEVISAVADLDDRVAAASVVLSTDSTEESPSPPISPLYSLHTFDAAAITTTTLSDAVAATGASTGTGGEEVKVDNPGADSDRGANDDDDTDDESSDAENDVNVETFPSSTIENCTPVTAAHDAAERLVDADEIVAAAVSTARAQLTTLKPVSPSSWRSPPSVRSSSPVSSPVNDHLCNADPDVAVAIHIGIDDATNSEDGDDDDDDDERNDQDDNNIVNNAIGDIYDSNSRNGVNDRNDVIGDDVSSDCESDVAISPTHPLSVAARVVPDVHRRSSCNESDNNTDQQHRPYNDQTTPSVVDVQSSATTTHRFFVERAVTNKARCRSCNMRINLNEWRFGVSISKRVNNPEPFKSWYHISCIHVAFAQPQRFAKFVSDPDSQIRDWAFVDADVRLAFIEQLVKLKTLVEANVRRLRSQQRGHRSIARRSGGLRDGDEDDDSIDTDLTNRTASNKRRRARRRARANGKTARPTGGAQTVVRDGSIRVAASSPTTTDDAKNRETDHHHPDDDDPSVVDLPRSVYLACMERFAAIENPNDDSLAAFDAVRRCLIAVGDVKDRIGVLRLWFSHGRYGSGFTGDVALWFRVLVSSCMNRSFGIKNKQLTKFFATKILHIPLGLIETRIRQLHFGAEKVTADDEAAIVAAELPGWQSRSSERRTSNKCLPVLLVDMVRGATNCKYRPQTKSTLTLQRTWSLMEQIASFNKEAARNQVLQTLLSECALDDVEPMLRILFSESGVQLSLRQVLTAFQPSVYNEWYRLSDGPKLNVYNVQHFDRLLNMMDFEQVRSYRYRTSRGADAGTGKPGTGKRKHSCDENAESRDMSADEQFDRLSARVSPAKKPRLLVETVGVPSSTSDASVEPMEVEKEAEEAMDAAVINDDQNDESRGQHSGNDDSSDLEDSNSDQENLDQENDRRNLPEGTTSG